MNSRGYVVFLLFFLFPLSVLSPAQAFYPNIEPYFAEAQTAPTTAPQAVAKGPQRLIVILVEFPDKKHSTTAARIRDIVFTELNDFYREVSYGQVSIAGDITSKWYQTQTPLAKMDLEEWTSARGTDMSKFRREAIQAADSDINFRNYDYVIIVSAGRVWPHALCGWGISTNDGSSLRGFVVNERTPVGTYAHELGHVLPTNISQRGGCGLPDLYSYEASEKDQDSSLWVGPWDLMDIDTPPRHFSAWSKSALGWISPETVRLGPTVALPVSLQPLEQDSGTRAIVVPLQGGRSYVIEVRRRIGFDRNLPSEGVLVYLLDPSRESGYGPLRVMDSTPKTPSLDDAPYKQGAFFEDPKNNVYIAVAFSSEGGFLTVVAGSKVLSLKDTDNDGLLDFVEQKIGTDPNKADTDGDGLKDGEEVNKYGSDPLRTDTDQDGLSDGVEVLQYSTNPTKADTDGDGLNDGDEVQKYQTNPTKADGDSDGLSDGREIQLGTNPNKADTDDDALNDGREVQLGTDPLRADSDSDQLTDGVEVNNYKTNPLDSDTDGDGLPDGTEVQLGADPHNPDTDGDGWRDGMDLAPTNAIIPNGLILGVVIVATALFAWWLLLRRGRTAAPAVRASFFPPVAPTTLPEPKSLVAVRKFCIQCGASLEAKDKFCPKCGQEL